MFNITEVATTTTTTTTTTNTTTTTSTPGADAVKNTSPEFSALGPSLKLYFQVCPMFLMSAWGSLRQVVFGQHLIYSPWGFRLPDDGAWSQLPTNSHLLHRI